MSGVSGAAAAPGPEVAPEDLLRAQWYRLFARFLSAPPGPGDLQAAAALEGDTTELGRAVARFAAACAAATDEDVAPDLDGARAEGVARRVLLTSGRVRMCRPRM